MNFTSSNIGPRDYKVSDIKRLFALSKNQCSKPGCNGHLIAEDGITVIGKICHIEAANKKGPRFNDDMTNDERRSFNNLILLCDEHHQIIDNKINESKYQKEILQDWKKNHTSGKIESDFIFDEEFITRFIVETKKYYHKIDSLDGPYKPQGSERYIERGIESELIKILYEKKVLLLTGVSFCGKSEIAKQIADYFFTKDYLYKRVLNTREASTFLESIGTNRVCILEDPFGHTIENENRSELRLIRDLFNNIPKNNLLIITSRKEIIHSIFNEPNLDDCKINNNKWHDLTTNEVVFLKTLWKKQTKDLSIRKENIDKVLRIIESGKTIQAGQLCHIAKLEKLTSKILTDEELYQLAQVDIDDICNDIIQKGGSLWKTLAILGFGSNTKDGLSYEDLDYISQDSLEYLSLEIQSSRFTSKSFGGQDRKEFKLPTYEENYNNISEIQDDLDFLEQRGYIKFTNDIFTYSHPHYLEISKTLLRKITVAKKQKLIPQICNTLSCTNSDIAFNCSKNLEYLLNTFEEKIQKDLVTIAYNVSDRSFYPKVADQCALFLTKIYKSHLVNDYKSDIIFKLQSKSEEYGIMFLEEEPVRWNQADFLDRLFGLNKQEFLKLTTNLSNDKFLTTEAVWKGLLAIKNATADVDINLLEYASKSNEVFVRNLCSYLYFLNVQKLNDSFLKDKLLTDEHPSVLFHGLQGFFQGIPNNSKYLNKELTERFYYFFKNDEIFCIRASILMSNFATDYATDSIKWKKITDNKRKWLWKVWAKFFIQFLKVFPPDVRFAHTPRFSGMMQEAKNIIYPYQGVGIAKEMLKRLKEIAKSRLIDNFEMHLIDFLIESTSDERDLRKSLIKNFFDAKLPTYFVGHNIVWTFGQWNNLLDYEKQIVYNVLKSDREDSRWLKAIVLNNRFLPPELIQEAIFDNSKFMQNNLEWLIKNIDESLLIDTITVHIGNDSALQESGLPGSSKWVRDLIYYIARNNLPITYERCISLFIVHFINSVPKDELNFYKKAWKEIYTNSNDKNSILNIVLKKVGSSSFCIYETSFLFEIIIKYHMENNNIKLLSSKLAENFEALSYFTSERDVFRVLNSERFIEEHLFPEMPIQWQILNLLLSLEKENLTKEENEIYVGEIIRLSNLEDIKLQRAFNIITSLKVAKSIDEVQIKKLQKIPNKIKGKQEKFHKSTKRDRLNNFKYFVQE
ncbi:hypothetical protein [Maribacter luteus]|uniref:Novel STAND NTPase 3 domain-containing protein n=1 Tax=Maribacter luteus TaxID=2594478 RepID=A0A6I2MSL4_9FLAO|nr:hypothetical protein [Maribacter luteus]MRX65420.1 hypothetical protein [Maribacter luteus]